MTPRVRAAATFREEAAAAIERYHRDIGAIWRARGRPPSCPTCERLFAQVWAEFRAAIRAASDKMDAAIAHSHSVG